MAGLYPDAPDHRMAYDRDGSGVAIVRVDTSSVTTLNTGQKQALNSETGTYQFTSGDAGSWRLAIVFPELRDVTYITAGKAGNTVPGTLQSSTDTTNGLDGSWTTVLNPWLATANSDDTMRTAAQAATATGVKALGFNMTPGVGFNARHIGPIQVFGTIASGENPDRLRLWHPTLDQEVGPAHFDWGDIAAGTLTKTFRVKNNSASVTANSITVSSEALSDTSPTNVSAYSYEIGGGGFSSSLNIGNLSTGAISGVITVRRITPANAIAGLWWTRIVASAASWS